MEWKDSPRSDVSADKKRRSRSKSVKSAVKRRKVESAEEPSDEEIEALVRAKERVLEQLHAHEQVDLIEKIEPAIVEGIVLTTTPPVKLNRQLVSPQNEATATYRHWDFLLQEMQWMATDFVQERRWRIRKAKMLSVSVTSYYNKKATAAARNSQQEEATRKRIAGKIGRDVKKFWMQIDKVVAHEVKRAQEDRQKEEMESQLQFLITQTEKYATALANTFSLDTGGDTDEEGSSSDAQDIVDGYNLATIEQQADLTQENVDNSDEDFEMSDMEPVDDETTIALEEAAQSAEDTKNELEMLEKESSMSIEELRAMYSIEPVNGHDKESNAAQSSDDDFNMSDTESVDDETTIAIEEAAQSAEDTKNELEMLEKESSMSIEELRAMYSVDSTNEGEQSFENSDEDFAMDDAESDDDETTIAVEEAAQNTEETQNELDLLEKESNMSIEELRALYSVESPNNTTDVVKESSDDDFEMSDIDPEDDETSIAKEEALQSAEDTKNELEMLEKEGNMSIEELRAMYSLESVNGDDPESEAVHDDDSHSNAAESTDDDFKMSDTESVDDETTIAIEEAAQSAEDTKNELELLEKEGNMSIEELRAMYMNEESSLNDTETQNEGAQKDTQVIQRKGDKLTESAAASELTYWQAVGVVRPFLLKNSLHLRAYQTAGVAWLLSLAHNRMNGILADEMGLGKTIQTISMLAALATEGIWGPHLIIVPTSCIVNWEMEFKRWCPAFKIMTYYGSAKRRKELRLGWSKTNAFQVCITSYQLVVVDAPCFKRKKWYYMILDEAHNIKNWKSQRWQTLLTFNTQRRLLLTGTPLQNNLMELWSLMHFLMPHLFRSRAQFTYWFNNPLNAMVEGETAVNDTLVARLHRIIRPFVLRRLKKDVAKQMPGKFEHVVMCPLSKRQAFLYEDFMARSSTRKTMAGGNFIGMMNVLMQLRKVCNHPDLFEPRPITSPWDVPSLTLRYPFSTIYHPPKVPIVPLLLAHNAWKRVTSQAPRTFVDDVSLPEPPSIVPPLVQAFLLEQIALKHAALCAKRQFLYHLNNFRCSNHIPLISYEMLNICTMETFISPAMAVHCADKGKSAPALQDMVENSESRLKKFMPLLPHVLCYVHKVRATPASVDISGPLSAGRVREATHWMETTESALGYLKPVMNQLHPIIQRSHLFFPDKRLVQFDCGKLQQLDRLLRDLKRGGHRCLIFSQMSSMLNILEIFLNIHGHTYFRLDGSTPVEKRQRLMDRFNSDPKVFCFILSTRSGGLGINLTGADTVIFYDSDWNPAMDAQAQDRAHRIGQTRDVHIYRLVSEHTVEENILKKAQQKRHLDALVMAEGEFTTEYFSKTNLRDLVSFGGETFEDEAEESLDMSTIEDAMAQLEDQEDVVAMQQAKAAQRVEKEQDEMDDEEESQPIAENDSDVLDISDHLRPIDRLAMRFRMNIDPLFAVAPSVPLETLQAQEELELERIEAEKIVEEEAVINDGELIVSQNPVSLKQQQQVYHRERMIVLRARRLRAISGEAWKIMTCLKSNLPYYYNTDTREAQWDVPRILMKNEDDRLARLGGYVALAQDVVVRILSFCTPLERLHTMALVCKSWSVLALHAQFYIRIHAEDAMSSEKLLNLQPGDTVVFGSGVHSVNTTVHVRSAVRFLAPLNGGTCTVQLDEGASLIWHANGGEIRGIHFTQLSSISSDLSKRSPLVMVPLGGKVSIVLCNFSGGDSSIFVQGGGAIIYDCNIHHASGSGIVVAGGTIVVAASTLRDNGQCGITVLYGQGIFRKNVFASNGRYGLRLLTGTQIATVDGNRFNSNCCGAIDLEHSTRRIVVRQSQVTPSTEMIKPHYHNSIKLHDVMLQDVCQEKVPRKKKEKVLGSSLGSSMTLVQKPKELKDKEAHELTTQ